MTSLFRKEHGFTIVELLIVIVVIGILAALVITTFSGIQQKGRDTERQTDIKALHAQIEAYYAQNGRYPTLANVQDRTATTGFIAVSLKGLDLGALQDPKFTTTLACKDASNNPVPAAASTTGCYGYTVTASDGTACDNTAKDCAKYTLTTTLEGTINGLGTFSKTSLN